MLLYSKLSWVQYFKVIHLVRDPRAMIKSRKVGGMAASAESRRVCAGIERDLNLSLTLPAHRWGPLTRAVLLMWSMWWRYIRVKYETLVASPFETLENLYNFSGIEITANIFRTLCEKTHGKRSLIQKDFSLRQYDFFVFSSDFYGTERSMNFNPNHWQTESTIEEIRAIEENCQSLLSLLDYPIYKGRGKNGGRGRSIE